MHLYDLFPLPGIAFSGKAGSGKTYLAEHVVRDFPSKARVVSFASSLKREVYEATGLVKGDPGAREAMIEHGRMRREENPRYWIDRCMEELTDSLRAGFTPVIDDLRFLNEYDFLNEWGSFIVRVDAPLTDRIQRFRSRGQDDAICTSGDRSECELDGADFQLRVFNRQHSSTARIVDTIIRESLGGRVLEALAA